MNVIAGKYRGRKLVALEGLQTRPTTQKVKTDMFNILNNWFLYENKISLDVFGGSGALSIEALSRGIKHAFINDLNPEALEIVKKNLHGIDEKTYTLINNDYKILLKSFYAKHQLVDLLILDAPFTHEEYYEDFFNYLKDHIILNNYGIIICEAPNELNTILFGELKILKHKTYKNKHLYILRKENDFYE